MVLMVVYHTLYICDVIVGPVRALKGSPKSLAQRLSGDLGVIFNDIGLNLSVFHVKAITNVVLGYKYDMLALYITPVYDLSRK